MNSEIIKVMSQVIHAGGTPLFVGGCVRDKLLHQYFPDEFEGYSKDIDIEVYQLSADNLVEIVGQFGKVVTVGKSFGVIKLLTDSSEYDFSLPRRDNKTGKGHKGFQVEVDGSMTPAEAAARRDFTMNSVAMDLDGKLIDPFDGAGDIKSRVLRATSDHFSEDPLRVLRGMQFAARFNMQLDEATAQTCKAMIGTYRELPVERVREEWLKWATMARYPGMGLQFLQSSGWVDLYPELKAIIDCPQDPIWHPEGCVMTHTAHVCDEAARIGSREALSGDDRLILLFAALCHDLGKATTTWQDPADGRWKAPKHAQAGEAPTRSFLSSIGFAEKVINLVVPLVREHMCHIGVSVTDRFVRRLSTRLAPASVNQLVRLIEADHSGRPPLPKNCPQEAQDILKVAAHLAIEDGKPRPIIAGRHLLGIVEPGPAMGSILNQLYEEQLDGAFSTIEQGIERAGELAGDLSG